MYCFTKTALGSLAGTGDWVRTSILLDTSTATHTSIYPHPQPHSNKHTNTCAHTPHTNQASHACGVKGLVIR
jgi:hypothetical protein